MVQSLYISIPRCIICRHKFKDGEDLELLECGHVFHFTCLHLPYIIYLNNLHLSRKGKDIMLVKGKARFDICFNVLGYFRCYLCTKHFPVSLLKA